MLLSTVAGHEGVSLYQLRLDVRRHTARYARPWRMLQRVIQQIRCGLLHLLVVELERRY